MSLRRHLQYARHLLSSSALPVYVILFVTEKCPNRCRHCFLGDYAITQRSEELTLDEIRKISLTMGELMVLLPTGGEPFIRKDLPEIINIFYAQNGLRYVGMPTSGYDETVIRGQVERILSLCPELELHIEVSLDGFVDTHNMIRGSDVSYGNAFATYEALEALAEKTARLTIGITSTFSGYNQHELLRFYRYLRDTVKVRNYTVLLTRGKPSNSVALDYDLSLFAEITAEMNTDLQQGKLSFSASGLSRFMNAQRIIRNNLVHDIAKIKRYTSPCFAGTLAGVIRSNGDVYPCEILQEPFGNLRENQYDFAEIWKSNKARRMVESIREERCCCTHECFLGVNILFNKRYLPEILYRGLCHC